MVKKAIIRTLFVKFQKEKVEDGCDCPVLNPQHLEIGMMLAVDCKCNSHTILSRLEKMVWVGEFICVVCGHKGLELVESRFQRGVFFDCWNFKTSVKPPPLIRDKVLHHDLTPSMALSRLEVGLDIVNHNAVDAVG